MAKVIHSKARVERIAYHVRLTMAAGAARGGSIEAATNEHLGPTAAAIIDAEVKREAALAELWMAKIVVREEESRAGHAIRQVRDAMWNVVGRSRVSPSMDQIFPGGLRPFARDRLATRPALMRRLHERLKAASVKTWEKEDLAGWAAEVRARQASLATKIMECNVAKVYVTETEAAYRRIVRTAPPFLRALKRALLDQGLTEAQVHEIIPEMKPYVWPSAVTA